MRVRLPSWAVARPSPGVMGVRRRTRFHGDLHLRNIVLVDGRPTLFDAIEFNDEIACGDVLYDLAFLLMTGRCCSGATRRRDGQSLVNRCAR